MSETALIVGAGSGLSASLARLFHKEGMQVALAARQTDKLDALCAETDAKAYACDASSLQDVEKLFSALDTDFGSIDTVVYNPSARVRGPFIELDPAEVHRAINITAYGAFLVAQAALKRMSEKKKGNVLFTGASAGVKGYPQSASFAMGKFAMRGLAQSLAREFHPQGIHIAHFVIDGGIRSDRRQEPADRPDSFLDPDAIADTYLHIMRQPRNSWSWEIELRPFVENF